MDIIWKESSGKTQDNGTRGCRGLCWYPARPCCSSLSEALLVPFHTTNSAWISLLPSLCFCLLLLSLLSYPIFPLEHIHTSIPISPPFLPCSLSPCILPSFPVKFFLAFPQAVFFLALPLKGTLLFGFISELWIWLAFCKCLWMPKNGQQSKPNLRLMAQYHRGSRVLHQKTKNKTKQNKKE